jgi:hypothetical protein
VGLADGARRKLGGPARDIASAPAYGVAPERTGDPVDPPAIDRQRQFKGSGGSQAMLGSVGSEPSAVTKSPGKYAIRRKRF